jgi:hypothetical protein
MGSFSEARDHREWIGNYAGYGRARFEDLARRVFELQDAVRGCGAVDCANACDGDYTWATCPNARVVAGGDDPFKPVSDMIFAARTTGGTAGPDELLCAPGEGTKRLGLVLWLDREAVAAAIAKAANQNTDDASTESE